MKTTQKAAEDPKQAEFANKPKLPRRKAITLAAIKTYLDREKKTMALAAELMAWAEEQTDLTALLGGSSGLAPHAVILDELLTRFSAELKDLRKAKAEIYTSATYSNTEVVIQIGLRVLRDGSLVRYHSPIQLCFIDGKPTSVSIDEIRSGRAFLNRRLEALVKVPEASLADILASAKILSKGMSRPLSYWLDPLLDPH